MEIRNFLKYVPSKDFKAFVGDLKKMYTAPSLKVAQSSFEKIKITWSMYPGAIAVWSQNFGHIEQLFDYGSAVRKIMYTTNAIESIHSSYRKVVKKGVFPNENAVEQRNCSINGTNALFRTGRWCEINHS